MPWNKTESEYLVFAADRFPPIMGAHVLFQRMNQLSPRLCTSFETLNPS